MFPASVRPRVKLQYFFGASLYAVEPGGEVAVTVYLQETFNPRLGSSLLAPGTDGLVRGSVLIQATPPLSAHPARVRDIASIKGNDEFDFALVPELNATPFADGAGIVELSANPVFGKVVAQSASCETVLLPLGTFTFTAGPIAGEVTQLTAMDCASDVAPGANNVTCSGLVLNSLIEPGTATITVSKKPVGKERHRTLAAFLASAEMTGGERQRPH
jgi:hypothetical protein